VYALAKIVTDVPAALSRRIDPRSGVSLVWGQVSAGTSANAIPITGQVEGTVRCLEDEAWHAAPDLLKSVIESVASTYGVTTELTYQRNAPPTVNDQVATGILESAAKAMLGHSMVQHARQSMGGEDFAWYLESVPGTLARLGTRNPEWADEFDIHQSTFDVDERAIGIGIRVMAATAVQALGALAPAATSYHANGHGDIVYSSQQPASAEVG
jgi:amidohydrolase